MKVDNLKAYLANTNIKQKDFCYALGYSQNYISKISNGKLMPSKKVSDDIKNLTDGVVVLPYTEDNNNPN